METFSFLSLGKTCRFCELLLFGLCSFTGTHTRRKKCQNLVIKIIHQKSFKLLALTQYAYILHLYIFVSNLLLTIGKSTYSGPNEPIFFGRLLLLFAFFWFFSFIDKLIWAFSCQRFWFFYCLFIRWFKTTEKLCERQKWNRRKTFWWFNFISQLNFRQRAIELIRFFRKKWS